MAFEDYKQKKSVVVAYTGEGKGKTSAGLGLLCRALGRGQKVAFIQFIKHWEVGEHTFIHKVQPLFADQLFFFKGGKGFFDAGELSQKEVSSEAHIAAAQATLAVALEKAADGSYDLVICDEINNAVHDGLLEESDMKLLIDSCAETTSLCLTGRNFPDELLPRIDIATNMTKIKHHFDEKFIANKGIDY